MFSVATCCEDYERHEDRSSTATFEERLNIASQDVIDFAHENTKLVDYLQHLLIKAPGHERLVPTSPAHTPRLVKQP